MSTTIKFIWAVAFIFTMFFLGTTMKKGDSIETIMAQEIYKIDTSLYSASITNKIDSIDLKIEENNVYTEVTLETNKEILEKKREELMQVGVCLDSINKSHTSVSVEILDCTPTCDTIIEN